RVKAITSVGSSWPLYRRLRQRIVTGPRNVTDRSASRRSPRSTAAAIRRTVAGGRAGRRPATGISPTRDAGLDRWSFRRRPRILAARVVHPCYDPDEFLLHTIHV